MKKVLLMCTLFVMIVVIPITTQAQTQVQQIQVSAVAQASAIDQTQAEIKTMLEDGKWEYASSKIVCTTADTIYSLETYTKLGTDADGNPTTLSVTIGRKSPPSPDLITWVYPGGLMVWCKCMSGNGFCTLNWGGGQFYCISNNDCQGNWCEVRACYGCNPFNN